MEKAEFVYPEIALNANDPIVIVFYPCTSGRLFIGYSSDFGDTIDEDLDFVVFRS